MAEHNTEPSGAQRKFGDFPPALVGYTDDVLFGQVWMRPASSRLLTSLERLAKEILAGHR